MVKIIINSGSSLPIRNKGPSHFPLIFCLLFLFLEIFHGDRLLTERTRIIRFQPILNTVSVEEMFGVTRQLDDLVVFFVIFHADDAFETLRMLLGLKLSFRHIFKDVSGCWNPLCVSPSLSSDSSVKCGAKAN